MADTERIQIVVDAEDNASSKLHGIKSTLSSMEGGINDFNYALRHYNSQMQSLNNGIKNMFKEMGSAVYDFTSDSIKNFTEFSEQHSLTLGAMANDYDKTAEAQARFLADSQKLKDQAINLGTFGINGQGSLSSIVDISGLQTELIKSGVKPENLVNSDTTSQVLTFAQANSLDEATAVEFATKLSNQFNVEMGTSDFGLMLDKVSHAADTSVIDVKDILQSMKYAAGVSAGLDRGVDETLGMISVLGNFGLTGSQAGSGIQAFLTRLLTGDTTVITEAQAEVAPPKALEAFYDFSKYAKSDGSAISYDDIINEKYTNTDITGNLRPMDEVTDALNETMGSLNDEEQAWFAKKLFGLYQMKSAYALINGEDGNLQSVIDEITNDSEGTNQNKLDQILGSQYGSLESFKNLITGIKTNVGSDLWGDENGDGITKAVLKEARNYLSDPDNYEIDWSSVQGALDYSCELIEEHYGTAISEGVKKLGTTAIDLSQIAEKLAPAVGEGLVDMIGNALDFDFVKGSDGDSVFTDWSDMIDSMNTSVGDLPEDMQDLGYAVVDVIDMFGKLTAFNMATDIAQLITSVLQIAMITIRAASAVIRGAASAVVHATSSTTQTTNTTVATTNATFGAINTQLMNVNASVVNINGGTGSGGSGGGGIPPVPPIAPVAGGGGLLLGGATAGGTGSLLLGGTVSQSATAGSGIASWLMDAGILTEAGGVVGQYTMTSGAGALLGGMPIVGMAIAELINNKLEEDKKTSLRNQVANMNDAQTVEYDKDGNPMIIDNAKTQGNAYNSKTNEYEYMNGHEETFIASKPKKKWYDYINPWSSYGSKLEEWEKQQEDIENSNELNKNKFYTTQKAYKESTGSDLKWNSYSSNKSGYEKMYQDYIKENIPSSQELLKSFTSSLGFNTGDGASISADNVSIDTNSVNNKGDYSSKIPGFNIMSSKGQADAINKYMKNEVTLNDNLTITPSFKIEAPNVKVDVKVDKNGNVSKETSILNQSFANNINSYYSRVTAQNGSTQK